MSVIDPVLFREKLQPLKEYKYDIEKILNICYPLRGEWSWSMKLNEQQKDIFSLVHTFPHHWVIIQHNDPCDIRTIEEIREKGLEKDDRFFVCAQKLKDCQVYLDLLNFLPEPDSDSEEMLEWPDESTSEQDVDLDDEFKSALDEIALVERNDNWKFKNPAYNPRLVSDIKEGFLDTPNGYTRDEIIKLIEKIKTLGDNEYVTTEGNVVVPTNKENIHEEFAIIGRANCLKSVKCLLFFKKAQQNYSLDLSVDEFVEKAEKRKCRWLWIRVGPGYYRDFNWMFLGNRDMITKTIYCLEQLGYSNLDYSKNSEKKFKFDLEKLWKLSFRKCLDLDTGKTISKENVEWYDEWGWTAKNGQENVNEIRGYILKKFREQYPPEMLPGKKDAWFINFVKLLNPGKTIIEFTSREPIKYTAALSQQYHFSKLGFALNKDEKNWSVEQIERCILQYHSRKKK